MTGPMKLYPVLRTAADWIVPPALERAMRRRAENFLASSLSVNRALEGRHADRKRCFVIGNGPSLKGVDLTRLKGEVTIGANSFYKHPSAPAMELRYLCIGDPHFFQDEPRVVDWHHLIEREMPKTTLILSKTARPLVEKHALYPKHETFYVETSGVPARRPSEVNIDFTKPLNVGQSTGTLVEIPLAMYLGFREIYLLGFDANWLENLAASYHFYDKHDHFPEFDSVAKDNRGFSYEQDVETVRREFESHRLLALRGRELGVQIWNATAGGRVDTYPRIRLDDVLST